MNIPKEAMDEFKQLYFSHCGLELDDSDTMEQAMKLLLLMKAVYKPIKEQNEG